MSEGILENVSMKGKVVLVSGGSEGIGYGMTEALANAGAKVVIASCSEEKGIKAAEALKASVGDRGEVAYVRADITRAEDNEAMVMFAVEKFGRLDGAINNAVYPGDFKLLADEPEESFDLTLSTNIKGIWLGMKSQINQFLAQGAKPGDNYSIINVSSAATRRPAPAMGPYNMSKTAVESLTRSAAVEYSPRGIRTNSLVFGVFNTEKSRMLHQHMPKMLEINQSRHKVGRFGDPRQDAGAAAIYLLSEASGFVTGSVLTLDGGMSL